jgi:soluble lytic murein transglycosylase-like protein
MPLLRRTLTTLILAGLCLVPSAPAGSAALPPIEERVKLEAQAMQERFGPIARRHGLSVDQTMYLATMLGSREWAKAAGAVGVKAAKQKALWKELNALPHPNFDQLTPYNLLKPGKDRWGVSVQTGLKGWKQWGPLIEEVAIAHGLDPAILGAYVWTESNFDTNQYYAARGLHAVGLGSVQAQDHPSLGPTIAVRVTRLQTDPRLNLTLTAKEFRARWNPQDMFGTVMDVWYPAWRSGRRIPSLGNAFGYMQLFSNRYFLLLDLQGM